MKKLLQSLFVMMLFAVHAITQDRTAARTTMSKKAGNPVPGATIRFNTKNDNQSDAAGKSSIEMPPDFRVIEIPL